MKIQQENPAAILVKKKSFEVGNLKWEVGKVSIAHRAGRIAIWAED